MRRPFAVLSATVLALAVTACGFQKVEGTGRRQLVLFSDQQMNQLGATAYQDVLAKEQKSSDAEGQAMVERVGKRLAAMAPDHGFTYEFNLIESDQVNAFCLPGGKVAIYTGILSYCKNEAGLAAVMGHEIAHAIADHGGERMSQGVLVQGAQTGLAMALEAKGVSPTTQNLFMTGAGLGAQVGVLLPFSRKHESEADYLGLIYMAKAGYDPKEAVSFWERFATLDSGDQPNFMRTHPASAERAKDLQSNMAQAMAHYEVAKDKQGAGKAVPARYRK